LKHIIILKVESVLRMSKLILLGIFLVLGLIVISLSTQCNGSPADDDDDDDDNRKNITANVKGLAGGRRRRDTQNHNFPIVGILLGPEEKTENGPQDRPKRETAKKPAAEGSANSAKAMVSRE
jgi:hypothetical protein